LFLLPVPLPRRCQSIDTLKTPGNLVPSQPIAGAGGYSRLVFNKGDSRMSNPTQNPGQQTQNPGQRNPGQKPGQQQQDPGQGRQ